MHRCLVNPDDWAGDCIPVSSAEAHHLLRVVRVGNGDTVSIFDGRGRDAVARVDLAGDGSLSLHVVDSRDVTAPGIDLTLLQAVPKGRRMELIIEKGTELGIRTFVPVLTERGVVRPDAARGNTRTERWQRIATSAARQCGVSVIPRVKPLQQLSRAIEEECATGVFLVGSLQDEARPLRDALNELRQDYPARINVLIGPEGDLTEGELSLAKAHGAMPVSFGPLVFRVETAALFTASVIAYEFPPKDSHPSNQ